MEKIKSILMLVSYAVAVAGGFFLGHKPSVVCPAPVVVSSNEKNESLKEHIRGTIKKKDANPATGAPAETEINFEADISSLMSSKASVVATPVAVVKPDNIKFPITSKGEIGIDGNVYGHNWISAKYNLFTAEKVYEYSYSTRIF